MRRESRHPGRHGRAVDDGEAGAMLVFDRATSPLFTLLVPLTFRGLLNAVTDVLFCIRAPIHASALKSPDTKILLRTGIRGTIFLLKRFIKYFIISIRIFDVPPL